MTICTATLPLFYQLPEQFLPGCACIPSSTPRGKDFGASVGTLVEILIDAHVLMTACIAASVHLFCRCLSSSCRTNGGVKPICTSCDGTRKSSRHAYKFQWNARVVIVMYLSSSAQDIWTPLVPNRHLAAQIIF
ncbi:hypothetical protein DUNSADRAFT_13439 [Dunaliella salina]|uniref:Encoded protein n=1 Tax=Dunaliella salina TaxID=3046 RepID=A0ABQ7G9F3_DUNSA|nr:hypothetical protein DUNSADRAFT_13439 [Dunaliella salina]|eukprot:KAF5831230.1 hypothetical protein DUNSADRAFT_13439 [Dunaliella salina]